MFFYILMASYPLGIQTNMHSDRIQSEVTLEDLFG